MEAEGEVKKVDLSVIIPIYNSESTIDELYNRTRDVLDAINIDYELILVDDGSQDGSWDELEKLHAKDRRVKIIQLMRNFGQHNTLMCGFHFAQGAYIITLDDDLQNPPEEIPKLIEKIREGYDLVYGNYISKKHNYLRNIGSMFIQKIYRKIFDIDVNLTSFRIMKKELVQNLLNYNKSYVFIDGLLAWNTNNIGFIPVSHCERKHGKSKYNFRRLLTLSIDLLTNFSIFPLQIISILGFLYAFLGFIMSVFFFGKKVFFDIPVPGYTSLIIIITVFSGVQLLTLGLIGEYIGRIHIKINEKPQYNIRNKLL